MANDRSVLVYRIDKMHELISGIHYSPNDEFKELLKNALKRLEDLKVKLVQELPITVVDLTLLSILEMIEPRPLSIMMHLKLFLLALSPTQWTDKERNLQNAERFLMQKKTNQRTSNLVATQQQSTPADRLLQTFFALMMTGKDSGKSK